MTHPPTPAPDDTEVTQLRRTLAAVRLSYANLLAAARATLAADHDGEPNPLEYLRDELTQHTTRPTHDPAPDGTDGVQERPDRGRR